VWTVNGYGSMFDEFRFHIVGESFDIDDFVRSCPPNMTGADFYALASDAYLRAIRRLIVDDQKADTKDDSDVTLIRKDFYDALAEFSPSLDENDIKQYERLQRS
jgi:peroxin-6